MLYEELVATEELDAYIMVKVDEAESSIAKYRNDGPNESTAKEIAFDGLLLSDEDRLVAEDCVIDEGMEEQPSTLFQSLGLYAVPFLSEYGEETDVD